MVQTSKSASAELAELPEEASRLLEHFQTRERQQAEREEQLAAARAAFRQEREAAREQIAQAKAEADRLTREARERHHEATRTRDNTKRLAARYARQAKHKLTAIRSQLEAQQSQVDEAKGQLSAERHRFERSRQEMQHWHQEELARQREAWAELETQRARLQTVRTESHQQVAKQEAALAARATEVAEREKHISRMKAKIETETTGLRQEAAGLEARVAHARSIVEELERKRDELRAEILTTYAKPEPEPSNEYRVPLDRCADRDLTQWSAELETQDRRQTEEKAALAKLKASLERESVAMADERKVLAEQFSLLGAARAEWQEQEGRTVAELEELARAMQQREDAIADREERIKTAESGRSAEHTELDARQVRLDEWQSKLLKVSQVWHEERERREGELAARMQTVNSREAVVQEMMIHWEQACENDRERMRAELRLWSEDRSRMAAAAAEYDRRSREALNEIAMHAARAMTSEDLAAEAAGTNRGATRRFTVLKKRWEQVFAKKLQEINVRQAAAASEFTRLEDRYDEIQRSLKELADRTAHRPFAAPQLRLVSELPAELPWATEEVEDEAPVVLPFAFNRAA